MPSLIYCSTLWPGLGPAVPQVPGGCVWWGWGKLLPQQWNSGLRVGRDSSPPWKWVAITQSSKNGNWMSKTIADVKTTEEGKCWNRNRPQQVKLTKPQGQRVIMDQGGPCLLHSRPLSGKLGPRWGQLAAPG